ncbi:MAG TPA: GGDEF domain-containing protein [Terracidiphilus sp.]
MNQAAPETLKVLPNPALFRAARSLQRIGLGVAATAILVELVPLAGFSMTANAGVARGALPLMLTATMCALSLLLWSVEGEGVGLVYARRIAQALVLFAAAVVVFWSRAASVGERSGQIVFPPMRLAFGFVALAMAVVLIERKNRIVNRIADVLVCVLCLLSLMLVANSVSGWLAASDGGAGTGISTAALACLIALTGVVALRQAEHGVFSIFLGVGTGSKLARVFAPILLLLPFVWQAMSTRLHGQVNAAVLTSAAVAVAFGILMFFAWRISGMENEIHDLVLRDEATRLYNQRGFHMLAEHALRLAKRSAVPFSVLFINLENLAQIHGQLGPDFAAASLAEAGEILRATFRESDIKGRIGADDFAVAGRFDRAGISVAALRLEAATAARNEKSRRPMPLRFSMGHVTTTDPEVQETLKDLLARAGHAKNRMDLQLNEMRVN